jgi:hypothetical protein
MDQFSLLTCRSARNRRDVPTTSLLITQAPRDQPTGGAVNERVPSGGMVPGRADIMVREPVRVSRYRSRCAAGPSSLPRRWPNTTDLSSVGSHEAVAWDFAGLRGGSEAFCARGGLATQPDQLVPA